MLCSQQSLFLSLILFLTSFFPHVSAPNSWHKISTFSNLFFFHTVHVLKIMFSKKVQVVRQCLGDMRVLYFCHIMAKLWKKYFRAMTENTDKSHPEVRTSIMNLILWVHSLTNPEANYKRTWLLVYLCWKHSIEVLCCVVIILLCIVKVFPMRTNDWNKWIISSNGFKLRQIWNNFPLTIYSI